MRGALAGVAFALAACRPSSHAAPPGFDAAATYAATCARCHGPKGKGDTPEGRALGARDLSSPEARLLGEEAVAHQIAVGGSKMPGFGGSLGEGEIRALARYVRTLSR